MTRADRSRPDYVYYSPVEAESFEGLPPAYIETAEYDCLHDDGILDVKDLEEKLHRIEVMASATGKIRAMFGMSSRALTSKEKTMIESWICGMQYSEEVLKLAYEITVNAIGKASIPYANSVLERWNAAGYRTEQDVQKAISDYRMRKNAGSSFDVDDFFEAAIRRTYGE